MSSILWWIPKAEHELILAIIARVQLSIVQAPFPKMSRIRYKKLKWTQHHPDSILDMSLEVNQKPFFYRIDNPLVQLGSESENHLSLHTSLQLPDQISFLVRANGPETYMYT